ncbi:MAG: phosphotransferase [Verrucomicrobia bacterium]|nr:phosphotransferase [Verrucomicrobiota bacterium]
MNIENPNELRRYLVDHGHVAEGDHIQFEVLKGGVSNRTVRIEREDAPDWVIKQALDKLRVSVDWFSDPERIHREADGLRWLERLVPRGAVPGFVFEDHAEHLLAMEAVAQPHENWKSMLLKGRLNDDHIRQFAHLLAAIHVGENVSRDELSAAFHDRSFFESLRLEPYYGYSATQLQESTAFLQSLIETTRATREALVHGDYSPKNILVRRGQLVLLDHEVIHFGDPAFDVGFSMTHLLSKAHHVVCARSAFAAAAHRYWHFYQDAAKDLSTGLEPRAVQHTLGCLLARVAGRSPLEYLSAVERQTQTRVALDLMKNVPERMGDLIDQFCNALDHA